MRLIVAAIALIAAPAVAQPRPAPDQARIATADLDTVVRRGAQLYAFDQAAWHSSDSLVARHLPEETLRAIRGWIVEPRGDQLAVTYYGLDGATPYAIYRADFGQGAVTADDVPDAAGRALSPLALRMVAALETARAQPFDRCVAEPFNTVTLPPGPDGTIPVYLLIPMVEQDAYPLGGHHEVDVGADGHVVATRDFTKSCLAGRPSDQPVALMVTHLLDPHPTEIHVYLSLWSGKPVYVATGAKTLWEVAGTRIARVAEKDRR